MSELNQTINWVPEHIKDGSFGKWIENARDWSISRNRFWGSPIPVWKCDGGTCEHPGEEVLAVGTDAGADRDLPARDEWQHGGSDGFQDAQIVGTTGYQSDYFEVFVDHRRT